MLYRTLRDLFWPFFSIAITVVVGVAFAVVTTPDKEEPNPCQEMSIKSAGPSRP